MAVIVVTGANSGTIVNVSPVAGRLAAIAQAFGLDIRAGDLRTDEQRAAGL
jgi:hypothetical protein